MRKLRLFIALGAILALSAPAYAQDDDDFGGDGMGDSGMGDSSMGDTSGGDTSGGDTGGGDTSSSGGSATIGGDFGQTDGAWGFQVSALQPVGVGLFAGLTLPSVGVRKWTGDSGIVLGDDGGGFDFGVIVGRNQQTSVRGLLEGTVGFVFYK